MVFAEFANRRCIILCTMKVAYFEIEDKLHWLLPYEKRRDNFEYRFNGPQSVKHLIELAGIPHTEIGEVKANEGAIGLDYLVQDGDRIQVRAVAAAAFACLTSEFDFFLVLYYVTDTELCGASRCCDGFFGILGKFSAWIQCKN